MRNWTPTDVRRLIAVIWLGGAGVASTGLVAFVIWSLRELALRGDVAGAVVNALANMGYGGLINVGIVVSGISAILGSRKFKLDVAGQTIETVGEEEAVRLEHALTRPKRRKEDLNAQEGSDQTVLEDPRPEGG